MAPGDAINALEARFSLYGLDAHARQSIKRLWPTIAPHLDAAVDAILIAASSLPHVSVVTSQHRDLIKALEVAHLKSLLSEELNGRYIASCRKTVEQEAAIGLDARFRSTAGNYLLRATIDALARKYRF